MGLMAAIDVADQMGVNETTIGWHFNHNCYPPVPAVMIDPALSAIAAFDTGDEVRLITLPDGVTYRGDTVVPAYRLVDSFHLESFIGV